jgi:hypothetical protein
VAFLEGRDSGALRRYLRVDLGLTEVKDLLRKRRVQVEIVRRLGLTPRERGSATNGTCPDVFLLDDGNFAVIGTDMTTELKGKLPADAALADYERIVMVSRETVVAAKKDIPEL